MVDPLLVRAKKFASDTVWSCEGAVASDTLSNDDVKAASIWKRVAWPWGYVAMDIITVFLRGPFQREPRRGAHRTLIGPI